MELPTEEYRPPRDLENAKLAVFLIELTFPFEENFVDTSIRKDTRYHDLASTVRSDGIQCTVWPVQVGAVVG